MSNNSVSTSMTAIRLWNQLLRSHLNVAAVGVLIILIGAVITFSLHHYADQLASINTPTTISAGQLEVGVAKSIANLRGWMSVNNVNFIDNRNKIWTREIYPAIEGLKQLSRDDLAGKQALADLETNLYDLDMWQSLVEEVAQTSGNLPAKALIEQQTKPVAKTMFTAMLALIDLAIITEDITTLERLLSLRSTLYLADNHLLDFVQKGQQFDKNNYLQIISEADSIVQQISFDKQGKTLPKTEQLTLFKHAYSVYMSLGQETIVVRSADDWNVAQFLLSSTVLPLEQQINVQLHTITTQMQTEATSAAAIVRKIGFWLPFMASTLLLLMLYISYRMAKKESHEFIKPVIELESAKEEIAQSLIDAQALSSALMQNQEHTRAIVDSSLSGIITISTRGLIQSFNTAAEQLFGYSPAEVIGNNVSMLMPAPYANKHDGYLQNFLRTDQAKIIGIGREVIGLRKDGTQFDMHLSVTEMHLEEESVFLGMVTDISEQVESRRQLHQHTQDLEQAKHQVEQALITSEGLTSEITVIVDSSPVAILTMDGEEFIRSFNPAAEHVFGYSEGEIIGKKMSTLKAAKGHEGRIRKLILEDDRETLRQGVELNIIRKDGLEITISMTISDVNIAGEDVWLFMGTDITKEVANRQQIIESNEELQANSEELQAQQEELRVTNEELIVKTEAVQISQREAELKAGQLEEASRYKSEFLANMSHELRTPLNSLLILSKSLADNDDGNLSKDEVESAQVVNEGGKSLLEMINGILDLSKAESGKMTADNSEVIISNLISDLTGRFSHMAADKGINFSISVADDVPNSLVSDGTKLSQILTNLIGNAIKFTEQGGVEFSIAMEPLPSSQQEKLVTFTVTDSGVGIAKEHQSSIFEAFQQADGSTNRQFGGTGLGLSIVQTFSKLLGGTVDLESEMGKGSRFTLYLPLKPSKNIDTIITSKKLINFEEKQTPPPFIDDRDELDINKSLYLIIEDDEIFAKILFETCHQQHSQALVAPDGETGIFLAKKYGFTGIILDYMLPGLDGKEVTAILKADPATSDIPVHIISAVDDTGINSLDIIGKLTKPVSKQDISAVLEQLKVRHNNSTMTKPKLLLIEDNDENIQLLQTILEKEHVILSSVRTGQQAISSLREQQFDAIIMELALPDMSGFELLEKLSKETISLPPVIVHTSKELSDDEYSLLKESVETIVIKSAVSPERLQDEVHLFINAMNSVRHNEDIQLADVDETKLAGKTVLITDDDMRNTFALAKVLRKKELIIHIAPSGEEALKLLEKHDEIDLVLMDIMMPEMDGYETMRAIRDQAKYTNLPIIALTAKAMTGDKEKCLEAGANDYLAKPVDFQKLLIMMQIWL
ncbi:MAG: response regulator [Methylophagaceae bacterium]